MRVVGTAGHVDHGKSTLVHALTGIDPDRLKEEQARQMTIDLGFAHFALPNGQVVSLIDVPGHRDFIENMLAGMGGIDAALFVVAADEGAMPQTREHLAILDLLHVPAGVVALTKVDLIDDPEWLDMLRLDLHELFAGTVLDGAPIIPVSAPAGTGLDGLQAALTAVLDKTPPRLDRGLPRLWLDRMFSISGFGTVVTGTLVDGQLTVGQEVELQPSGIRARIRGLQAHSQPVEIALPGSRTAVNLAGVTCQEVRRGDLLTLPGLTTPTTLIDVSYQHLPTAARPLKHNTLVKLFCGSTERLARVRVLAVDALKPGESGWLQLQLSEPLPITKGDRFILRVPSPGETVGGGAVIDPHPGQRWRRTRPDVIAHLETLSRGDPADLIRQALDGAPLSTSQLADVIHLSAAELSPHLAAMPDVETLSNGLYVTAGGLERLINTVLRTLTGFHRAEPLRRGMAAETLRSRLQMELPGFRALMAHMAGQAIIRLEPTGEVALPEHSIRLNPEQQAAFDWLTAQFAKTPFTPPSYRDAESIVGAEVLCAVIERGDLIQIAPDVVFMADTIREIALYVHDELIRAGIIDVKTVRDHFSTSRKYALAVLEYFDSLDLTRRVGDHHVLGAGDWTALCLAASSASMPFI